MGRRNDHTREEIREAAIQAAQLCIQQDGIQGINARHIAQDIGYAVGTLYQLFKNMDLLILAVNLRTLKALEQHVLAACNSTLSAQENMQQMALAYVDFALHNTPSWQAVFAHQLKDEQDMPQAYQEQRLRLFTLVEQQFKAAFPDMDAQQVSLETRALWAGIHGICSLTLSHKLHDNEMTLNDIAHTLIAHFLQPESNQQGEKS
ncbi:MAG: TetR/AcrR family transcriptional regulator [Mariprofundaceae bacterium]|nr:TetR/AcrR family transcriptional regulator [Mariprofundaceae bacterium]